MRNGINAPRGTFYGVPMTIDRMKQSNKAFGKGSLAVPVDDGAAVIVAGRDVAASLQLKGFGLKITDPALQETWPKGVAVVRQDELPLYHAGQVFRTPYLNRLREFSCIRFMDQMQTNANKTGKYDAPVDARTYMDAMPIEVMASLCNTLGADAWINIPVNMSDEDALALVRAFRAALHPSLSLYVELSNEVWNADFWASQYAAEQGALKWAPEKGINIGQRWYGYRSAQLAKLVAGEGIRFCIGTQTMNPGLSASVFKGFDEAGGDNATVHSWIITCYIDGRLNKDHKVLQLAAANDVDGALNALMNDPNKGVVGMRKVYPKHAAIAASRGWKLTCYEGNFSLIPKGAKTAAEKAAAIAFVDRVYSDPRAKDIAKANLEALRDAGCDLVCHFNMTHKPSESGVWGLFKDLDDEVGKPWIQAAREV